MLGAHQKYTKRLYLEVATQTRIIFFLKQIPCLLREPGSKLNNTINAGLVSMVYLIERPFTLNYVSAIEVGEEKSIFGFAV